jgi:hypothetical protein
MSSIPDIIQHSRNSGIFKPTPVDQSGTLLVNDPFWWHFPHVSNPKDSCILFLTSHGNIILEFQVPCHEYEGSGYKSALFSTLCARWR